MIEALSHRYHEIAKQELERTLGNLPNITPAEREHLEDLTRRLVNKLLHDPITTLRNADTVHGPTVQYLHALAKLFHLKDDEIVDAPPPSDEQQNAK